MPPSKKLIKLNSCLRPGQKPYIQCSICNIIHRQSDIKCNKSNHLRRWDLISNNVLTCHWCGDACAEVVYGYCNDKLILKLMGERWLHTIIHPSLNYSLNYCHMCIDKCDKNIIEDLDYFIINGTGNIIEGNDKIENKLNWIIYPNPSINDTIDAEADADAADDTDAASATVDSVAADDADDADAASATVDSVTADADADADVTVDSSDDSSDSDDNNDSMNTFNRYDQWVMSGGVYYCDGCDMNGIGEVRDDAIIINCSRWQNTCEGFDYCENCINTNINDRFIIINRNTFSFSGDATRLNLPITTREIYLSHYPDMSNDLLATLNCSH